MPDSQDLKEKGLSSAANKFVGRVLQLRDCLSPEFDSPPLIHGDVIRAIQSRQTVSDAVFDQFLPPRFRLPSPLHWATIEVARNVAGMIEDMGTLRFIDIGSGVGKLCILLNFLTGHRIFGIEQRKDLYDVGEKIVKLNDLERVTLIHGNMLDLDWEDFDIFFLYNPFYEHICNTPLGRIDEKIELDRKFYALYTSEVFRRLTWARRGQRLITFHGYGGSVPKSWSLQRSVFINDGNLSLWEKE